jgi:hypothetical protein
MRKFRPPRCKHGYFHCEDINPEKIYAGTDEFKRICVLTSTNYEAKMPENYQPVKHKFLVLKDINRANHYPEKKTRQEAILNFNTRGNIYEFETLIEFLDWALAHEKTAANVSRDSKETGGRRQ